MGQIRSKLAVHGGDKTVKIKSPHFIWPPISERKEKIALALQRDIDISIKGKSGPIKEFEDKFLSFLGNKRKYGITFNSGTSALLAAYFSLGIEEGDEIIAPALTFHAAISPVYILRANPILVDIDKNTYCIDPEKIEKAITKKTKAIVVVHQWGHPADMDPIIKVARKYNLGIVEDCSHAHGSMYKGKKVGLFSDVAVFSLQANKILFAGEGGILVTNSKKIHDRATLLGHYRDRSRDETFDKFLQQFWVSGYGLKLRMSPYNAITAIYSLEKLDERLKTRQKALSYLSKKLLKFKELKIPYTANYVTKRAWYGYKVLYDSNFFFNIPIRTYVQALIAEGVEVKVLETSAFSELPLFTIRDDRMFRDRSRKIIYKSGDFPIAENISGNAFSFPAFTRWPESKKIIDQYIDSFRKVHKYYEELLK